MALGKTVITCAPILMTEALSGGRYGNGHYVCEEIRANSSGHSMTAAEYAILGVLVAIPVIIIWLALSAHEF